MTLVTQPTYDNAQVPSATSWAYLPDQLIAGGMHRVTHNVTLAAGAYPRGTVLGQVDSFSATVTPKAGNTGNGTIGPVTGGVSPKVGAYLLTATAANTFSVVDPEGVALGNATVGQAFNSAQIDFTITAGGTAFVAGDAFTVSTLGGIGDFKLCVKTATDGSQVPCAITAENADATQGPVRVGIYATGEFNIRAVNYDPSWTPELLVTALRPYNIHLKSSLSAADPS